jgi:hypothetical protein
MYIHAQFERRNHYKVIFQGQFLNLAYIQTAIEKIVYPLFIRGEDGAYNLSDRISDFIFLGKQNSTGISIFNHGPLNPAFGVETKGEAPKLEPLTSGIIKLT